jgi:hypothetical protein
VVAVVAGSIADGAVAEASASGVGVITGLTAAVSVACVVSDAAAAGVVAALDVSIAGRILSVPVGEAGAASVVDSDAAGVDEEDSGLYILKLSCGSPVAANAIGIDPTEIMALRNTGRRQRLINFSTYNSE